MVKIIFLPTSGWGSYIKIDNVKKEMEKYYKTNCYIFFYYDSLPYSMIRTEIKDFVRQFNKQHAEIIFVTEKNMDVEETCRYDRQSVAEKLNYDILKTILGSSGRGVVTVHKDSNTDYDELITKIFKMKVEPVFINKIDNITIGEMLLDIRHTFCCR
jgi:vacuolar-type H+-ATPase subunit F/Vma7